MVNVCICISTAVTRNVILDEQTMLALRVSKGSVVYRCLWGMAAVSLIMSRQLSGDFLFCCFMIDCLYDGGAMGMVGELCECKAAVYGAD